MTSPAFQSGVKSLTAIRRHRGLTQAQVAARMGVAQGQVSGIEDPMGNTTVKTLERYAAAIGAEIKLTVRMLDTH